jgi:hypothetical protein
MKFRAEESGDAHLSEPLGLVGCYCVFGGGGGRVFHGCGDMDMARRMGEIIRRSCEEMEEQRW